MSLEIRVGQRVMVKDQPGIVRFFGLTQFAEGEWVGVELDSSAGRNDGSVNDVRYFTCLKKGQCGVFVRPALVKTADGSNPVGMRNVEALIDRLQQKLKRTLTELETQRETVEQLETSIASKDAKIENLESTVETTAVDLEYINAQKESLENSLKEIQSSYSKLKEEYEFVAEELNLTRQLEEEALAQAPSDLDTNEVAKLISQNKRLGEELASLKLTSSKDVVDLDERGRALNILENEFATLKSSHTSTKEALQQSEETIKMLQLQLETISSLEDLIEHLSSQNDILSEKVNDLTTTIQELNELHEIDVALLSASKESESKLQCEVSGLTKSMETLQKTIDGLAENNENLKRKLNKYLSREHHSKEAPTSSKETLNFKENDHIKTLLAYAKSSRGKIVDEIILSSLRKQVRLLLEVIDTSAEARALLDFMEGASFGVQKIILGINRALGHLLYLEIILRHNVLDDKELSRLKSHVVNARNEVEYIKSKYIESDTECIDSSNVLSSLSNIRIFDGQLMNTFASQYRALIFIQSEANFTLQLIRFLETISTGKRIEHLAKIYKSLKSILQIVDLLLRQFIDNEHKELDKPLFVYSEHSFTVNSSLWSVCLQVVEIRDGAMTDQNEQITKTWNEFLQQSDAIILEAEAKLKHLEDHLHGKSVSFLPEKQNDIFSKTSAARIEGLNERGSPVAESRMNKVKELELNISILEQNLSTTGEKLAAALKDNARTIAGLKDAYKDLEVRYNNLTEENQMLEKQAREYLDLEVHNIVGQQTKYYKDLAAQKKYTEESMLFEEISLLRRMIREGPSPMSINEGDDILWLLQPIFNSPQQPRVPRYINDAWKRRAYAVRMLNLGKVRQKLNTRFTYLKNC